MILAAVIAKKFLPLGDDYIEVLVQSHKPKSPTYANKWGISRIRAYVLIIVAVIKNSVVFNDNQANAFKQKLNTTLLYRVLVR